MCHHCSAASPPKQDALRRLLRCATPVALLLAAASAMAAPSTPRMQAPNLPLTFERNTGHWPKDVQFVARSGQGTLFLTRREAVVALTSGKKSSALRLKLAGSNPGAAASGLDKQAGVVNYFMGKDPKKWRTNVPTYSRVKLAAVYPGIDLVYYGAGKGRTLEYDFVVKPGADASRIRMAVSGAKSLRTVGGKLIASTACGDVTLNRPYAYQTVDGIRKQVACAFTLERNTIGFQVARYDASRPLVVDPTLAYGTLLGGSGADKIKAVAVDAAGAAYVCGYSASTPFPTTTGAYQTAAAGGTDAVVSKLSASGAKLVYSTYLGGAEYDEAKAIAVDATGAAYVCGETNSAAFPTTTGAFQTTHGADSAGTDNFVTKLGASGASLAYSTFLGGTGADSAYGIALDTAGSAYIGGYTDGDFPTTAGAYQTVREGGIDATVTKLDPSGTYLTYSTYLGGTGNDYARGIAVDSTGAAFIGYSDDWFPTTPDACQTIKPGGVNGFVTKLNAGGTALIYSTYLGGSGSDYGYAIAIDGEGAAYLAGYTNGESYTTPNAYQAVNAGGYDGFVTKLDPTGTGLVYNTLIGGAGDDKAKGIAVDAVGGAFITGSTKSAGYPVTAGAAQSTHAADGGQIDAFLTQLDPSGTCLTYSSYLGGTYADEGASVAVDATGAAIIGGYSGAGFPCTANAYQTQSTGGDDGMVAKFSFGQPTPTVAVDSLSATEGGRVTLRGRLSDAADAGISGMRLQFSIDSGPWVNSEILTSAAGVATLTITAPAAGTHTLLCRFEAAEGYAAADGPGTLDTTTLLATVTAVNSIGAGPGDALGLVAYLRIPSGTSIGAGIAGKALEFQFNGGAWTPASALTDAVGKATLAVTAPGAAGSYTINTRFAGDATYAASSGTADLTVAAKRNVYVYTINRSVAVGGSTRLIAYFYWYQRNGTLTPVSGKSLRFQCAGVSLDSTVTTDAAGKATLTVSPATVGAFPFTVDFTADADYNAGSGSGTLTVAP